MMIIKQIQKTKWILEDTDNRLRSEIKKQLGEEYLVSIHYHFLHPIISVWHKNIESDQAPDYTLYNDHLEVTDNKCNSSDIVFAAIKRILYND